MAAFGKPLLVLASALVGGGISYYAENQESEEFLQKLERFAQYAEDKIAQQEAELQRLRNEASSCQQKLDAATSALEDCNTENRFSHEEEYALLYECIFGNASGYDSYYYRSCLTKDQYYRLGHCCVEELKQLESKYQDVAAFRSSGVQLGKNCR